MDMMHEIKIGRQPLTRRELVFIISAVRDKRNDIEETLKTRIDLTMKQRNKLSDNYFLLNNGIIKLERMLKDVEG